MQATSALAIYVLFWVMSAFLVMPFGVKTPYESGDELVPGQAESAPSNFNPQRIIMRTTILSAIIFAIFYANYVNGWLTADMLDFTLLLHPPAQG